jgi:hypothetical protein
MVIYTKGNGSLYTPELEGSVGVVLARGYKVDDECTPVRFIPYLSCSTRSEFIDEAGWSAMTYNLVKVEAPDAKDAV